MESNHRPRFAWPAALAFLVVGVGANLLIGPGGLIPPHWHIRLTRTILSLVAGGTLGLVGATLQGVTRNSLADPFTLGVASGAALGSALTTIVTGHFGPLTLLGGFAGAAATMLLVYLLARIRNRVTTTSLVLAGVTVSFVLSSLTMLTFILSRRTLGEAVYALMGHLGFFFTRTTALIFGAGSLAILAGSLWLIGRARSLDIATLDDDSAESLGEAVSSLTVKVFLITSAMVGIVVSFTGAISFVGLVVPHLVRLLQGPKHKGVLTGSFLTGAALLLLADVASRQLVPGGIPLSIVTTIVGVPFFVWLMRRSI